MMQHTRPEHRVRASHSRAVSWCLGAYVVLGLLYVLMVVVIPL